MRLPDFYIVGAPKCGTTAMYQWLHAHPEIFLPAKETHFYGQDLDHRRPPMTQDQYQALYADASPAHRAIGDVAVWHLMSETAAASVSLQTSGHTLTSMGGSCSLRRKCSGPATEYSWPASRQRSTRCS